MHWIIAEVKDVLKHGNESFNIYEIILRKANRDKIGLQILTLCSTIDQ